ncbi:MAG: hypothetical protein NPIRA02_31130 [Nitrospirales bacterium]|nr:MAG: hypothetical protein NPIRA02_31130 [Nitrospirales bacterium]
MENVLLPSLIKAFATIAATLIAGITGIMLSRSYLSERDKQDKESQWRQHAIELTKLDVERKLKTQSNNTSIPRPSILDFLANYRSLQELGEMSPRELYDKILESRIISNPDQSDKSDNVS